MNCTKKAAVVCIFRHGDRILFVKRARTNYAGGFYMLPGGHVEENETVRQAAVREIAEELDITVSPDDLVFKLVDTTIPGYVVFVFEVPAFLGDLKNKEPDKHSEFKFLPPDAPEIFHEMARQLHSIRDNISFLG